MAIGELADGLDIDLDQVPKKYEGLDGTELAISESPGAHGRGAWRPRTWTRSSRWPHEENLEATVGGQGHRRAPACAWRWNGDTIVDLSREFLDSNGAPKHTSRARGRSRRALRSATWAGATFGRAPASAS